MTTPTTPDYYQVLGVPPTATTEQITASYRKLAKTHHPDRGGDKLIFQAAKAAYGILSDPASRAQYDASRTPAASYAQPPRSAVPPNAQPFTPPGMNPQYHGFPGAQPTQPQYHVQPDDWAAMAARTPGLGASARRLRAIQYTVAAAVAALWYVSRVTGVAQNLLTTKTNQELPAPLRHPVGHHFTFAALAIALALGLGIELMMGIGLRVDLAKPAVLRYAIGPTIAAGFLIGEYLLTTRGLLVWAAVAVLATLVSVVITLIRSKAAWLKEL
jgi:hypothetical protein